MTGVRRELFVAASAAVWIAACADILGADFGDYDPAAIAGGGSGGADASSGGGAGGGGGASGESGASGGSISGGGGSGGGAGSDGGGGTGADGGATGGSGGLGGSDGPADAGQDSPDLGVDAGAVGCAIELTAGGTAACVLRADGTVWCWGDNRYGALGDGTITGLNCGPNTCKPTPQQVSAVGSTATEVSAGLGGSVCVLKQDDTAWCWGRNDHGQLGDGTTGDAGCAGVSCKPSPVQITALGKDTVSISAGGVYACARTKNTKVSCWGYNGSGELGDGTLAQKTLPTELAALGAGCSFLSAGLDVSCAVKSDGTTWCWGRNDFGQVGDGTFSGSRTPPVQVVPLGSTVKQVESGQYFTCALKSDGTVWCWGLNDKGQLGGGATDGVPCNTSWKCKPTPTAVVGLGASVEQISVGNSHACARKKDGTVWCWGENNLGQLGDGTTAGQTCGPTFCKPAPVQVASLGNSVSDVQAGGAFGCARRVDNTVWCWGHNAFGQVGDGSPAGQQCSGTVCVPTPAKALIPCP
ncbi:MAG: hypothetical protein HYZ29_37325 [Myxococcales bacterium]|nr:hypothetical protein [Myxococcales bacterium]